MAVRANWFLDHLEVEDDTEVDVTAVGQPIELDDEATLNRHLVELVRKEAALANHGVECDIKWAGASCALCPLRHTDPDDPMAPLCGIGLEQERTTTALVVRGFKRRT